MDRSAGEAAGHSAFWKKMVGEVYFFFVGPIVKRLLVVLDALPASSFEDLIEYIVALFYFCLSDFTSGSRVPKPPVKILQTVMASLLELVPQAAQDLTEPLDNRDTDAEPREETCYDLFGDDDWPIEYAEAVVMTKVMIGHFLPDWVIRSSDPDSPMESGGTEERPMGQNSPDVPGLSPCQPCQFPTPHPIVEFILSIMFSPPMACFTFFFLVKMRQNNWKGSRSKTDGACHAQSRSMDQLWVSTTVQSALYSSWTSYGEDLLILAVCLISRIFSRHDPECITSTPMEHAKAPLSRTPHCSPTSPPVPNLDAEVADKDETSQPGPCSHPPPPVQIALSALMHFNTHYLLFHSAFSLIRSQLLPVSSSQTDCETPVANIRVGLEFQSCGPSLPPTDANVPACGDTLPTLMAAGCCTGNPFGPVESHVPRTESPSSFGRCSSAGFTEPSLMDVLALFPSVAFTGFRGYSWREVVEQQVEGRNGEVGGGAPSRNLRQCSSSNLCVCFLICIRDVMRCYLRRHFGFAKGTDPASVDGVNQKRSPDGRRAKDWAIELRNIVKSIPHGAEGLREPGSKSAPARAGGGGPEAALGDEKYTMLLARVVRKYFEATMLKGKTGHSIEMGLGGRDAVVPRSEPTGETTGSEDVLLPDSLLSTSAILTAALHTETGDIATSQPGTPPSIEPLGATSAAVFLAESTLLKIIRKTLYAIRAGQIHGSTEHLDFTLVDLHLTDFDISRCRVCLQTVGKSYKSPEDIGVFSTSPPHQPTCQTDNHGSWAEADLNPGTTNTRVENGKWKSGVWASNAQFNCTPPLCPRIATSPTCHQPTSDSPPPAQFVTQRSQFSHDNQDVNYSKGLPCDTANSAEQGSPSHTPGSDSQRYRKHEGPGALLGVEMSSVTAERQNSNRAEITLSDSCSAGHLSPTIIPAPRRSGSDLKAHLKAAYSGTCEANVSVAGQSNSPLLLIPPNAPYGPTTSLNVSPSPRDPISPAAATVSASGDLRHAPRWRMVQTCPQEAADISVATNVQDEGGDTERSTFFQHAPQQSPGPPTTSSVDSTSDVVTPPSRRESQGASDATSTSPNVSMSSCRAYSQPPSQSSEQRPVDRGGSPSEPTVSKSIHFRLFTDRLVIGLSHDWIAKVTTLAGLGIRGSSQVQLSECEVTCFASLSLEKGLGVQNVTVKIPHVEISLSCTSSLPQLVITLIVRIFKEALRSYIEERVKAVLTYRIEKLCSWFNVTIWRRLRGLIPEPLLCEFLEFVDYSIPLKGIFV